MNHYENRKLKIPFKYLEKWKKSLNLLAKTYGVNTVVLKKYNKPFIKVINKNLDSQFLLKEGKSIKSSKLLSNKVIESSKLVIISNLNKNLEFSKFEEVKYGYLAYLGVPLKLSTGEIFGIISLYYKKLYDFEKIDKDILYQTKELIESHLEIISKDFKKEKYSQLYKSEEKQNSDLINKAPIGIFKTTSKGRIISINPKMADILGFNNKNEALKYYKNLKNDLYLNPEQREKFIYKLKIKDEVKNFEYIAKGKNNRKIWISMNAKKKKIFKKGDFLIQGFAYDISERKNKDKKLKQKKEQLIKLYEKLTIYNEEVLAMNEELEGSLKQMNDLNNRFKNMIELVSKTNSKNILNEQDFFNDLLERAIEIIPEADYGKIGLINNEDQFEFVDSIGHDIKILKNLKFDKKILFNKENSDVNHTTDYFFDNEKIESEKIEFLKGLKPVKESLYINVLVEGTIAGRIGFDIKEGSQNEFSNITRRILESFSSLVSSFFTFKRFDDLQNNFTKEMLTSIIKILEMYDQYTKGHSENVAKVASAIAKEMNLSKKAIRDTYWAGLVHDIGKLLLPINILNKKGKLKESEYGLIKKHPIWGNKALKHSKELKPIAKNILHHHERWDGTGYPNGLKGDEIPLISQIIAVADSWDAMLSKRAYRDSLSVKQAINEIKNNKDKQFSPEVVKAFLYIVENKKLESIKNNILKNEINETKKRNKIINNDLSYEVLFEESNSGIVIIDPELNIIRVNDYFLNMFGYKKNNILGANIENIVPKDKISETQDIIKQLNNDKKIFKNTIRKKSNNKMINVS
ncbi:MAG: HD domain-containing phosphohydrolase, partial [Bacillota bacterium]